MAGLYLSGKVVAPVVTKEVPEERFGLTLCNFIGDIDENGQLLGVTSFSDMDIVMNGVTQVNNTLNFAYTRGPRSISFPDITIVSDSLRSNFRNTFYGNSSIKIIDFSSLTEILTPKDQVFWSTCENGTNVDLVDFRNLQKVDGGSNVFTSMFKNGVVKSLNFDSLEYINGPHFYSFCYGTGGLTDLSFPKLKRIYNNTGLTSNGNYQAFYYCNRLVNVNMPLLESVNDYFACGNWFQGCTNLTSVDLSNLTTISGQNACGNMFYGCNKLTSLDLSSLTSISGQNACNSMFYNCANLPSIELSSLISISGDSACYSMFYNCTNLPLVDLSNLTSISGQNACHYMFYNCSGLTSVDLSNLTSISGNYACNYMFQSCSGLTSVDLGNLTTISGNYACQGMFSYCKRLMSISFPSLTTVEGTNPFGTSGSNLIFYNCTALTEIHFRSDMRSTIEALPGYSTKFGATNATIYFDL